MIKVAFVGTSCVGKSSLLNISKERIGSQAVFVEEAAREYFMAQSQIADRLAFTVQSEIQALAFRKERAAHSQAANLGRVAIVCDRSVLDAAVYVSSQGNSEGANILLERARPWISTYNRIYLLDPADVPFSQDDVRSEDEATRQLFHDTFLDFLATNDIPYDLLSGDIEERFRQVNNFIVGSQNESIIQP